MAELALIIAAGTTLMALIAAVFALRNAAQTPEPRHNSDPDYAVRQDAELFQLASVLPLSPAMVEVYMELGNLFRQRGEIERAIAIRQMIIDNSGISEHDRLEAYYAMGLDFRHAGLFNRAIETLQELITIAPEHTDAGRQLVYLYEEVREWDKAFSARKRVDKVLGKTSPMVLAHYKTEQGKELADKNPELAEAAYGLAIRYNNRCLDAYLHLGDLYLKENRPRKAFDVWRQAAEIEPACAHFILARLDSFKDRQQAENAILQIFSPRSNHHPLFLLELAKWRLKQNQPEHALELLQQALNKAPGFMAAHDLRGQILLKQNALNNLPQAYRDLLGQIKDTNSTSYRCAHCGFTSYSLSWQCPRCRHWDSIAVLTY